LYYTTFREVAGLSKAEKDIDIDSKMINRLIKKAVKEAMKKGLEAGLAAGRAEAERPANTYKTTEDRLYALPILIKRVSNCEEYLDSLEACVSQGHSKDIVRFSRSSSLSAEDKVDALIADGKAKIAADQHEIDVINKALENIKNDTYYLVVKGRYFEHLSDEEIAKQIPCDASTVRHNRGRLVRILAVWLYGVEAINSAQMERTKTHFTGAQRL
jgi:hypothetical protein